ncbi:MAG: nucleotidyltransferase family protein [Gaiellales bacterium]
MTSASYAAEEVLGSDDIWTGVGRVIDRAPSLAHLRRHRLHLLAAHRWRSLGRPLPPELADDERRAAMAALAVPILLERVRAGCDDPVIVFKGPEVAARYPNPALRDFVDLDILVPDAAQAQRSLIEAGFREFGDPELYVDIHHLRPLFSAPLQLRVEVHSAPKWLDELEPPPASELFSGAVPSATGVEGILALPPAQHAVVLAVHSWAHEPLARLGHLVDIAAILDGTDRNAAAEIAGAWGVRSLWDTTLDVADAVFLGRRGRAGVLNVWARHLRAARERTVFEHHVERWMSGFWALPAGKAARQTAEELWWDIRPTPGESWRRKLSRTGRAFRDAFVPRSEHDRALGPEASRRRDRPSV